MLGVGSTAWEAGTHAVAIVAGGQRSLFGFTRSLHMSFYLGGRDGDYGVASELGLACGPDFTYVALRV